MIDFQVKIAGAAGEGVMAVGLLAAKAFAQAGLYVFNYSEYPSLIRGGHNTTTVRASNKQIGALSPKIEILVALNGESFEIHEDELVSGGILLWDQRTQDKHSCKRGLHCVHVPLRDLSAEIGNPIVANTVALGALAASLNFPQKFIDQALKIEFSRKGSEIVKMNQKAAKIGYEYFQKNYQAPVPADLGALMKENKKLTASSLVMSGNEAVTLGALAADCKFYAGYPMTPSTGIFHAMAELGPKVGLIFKQTEDEISAINMILGASYGGVRSLTATSGGGFCLMAETLGLAAQTETPLVIVEAMRPGPATGLPTWTEQGDLRTVLHAGQGDFLRVVLSPGDSDEAMRLTHLAYDLADEYQIPVIILSDKYLAENATNTTWLAKSEQKNRPKSILSQAELGHVSNYQRYKITEDGISPRALPGMAKGIHPTNSDEHNPSGFSDEGAENRAQMMEKRYRKLAGIRAALASRSLIKPYGQKTAKPDITLFSFGSNKWPVREAVDILGHQNLKVSSIHLPYVWPLPLELVHYFERSDHNIVVENNYTGQLEGLMRQEYGLAFDQHIRKFDGRPFMAEEIVKQIKS